MVREVPGCSGKRPYPSKRDARRALVQMRSKYLSPGQRLGVYLCHACIMWHIGRSTADEREYVRFKVRHAASG